MTDLHKRATDLLAKCEGMTEGPWVAALERGCHGVIAQKLPETSANFVALVGNDAGTKEREPERFANARAIAALPEALALIRDLTAALSVMPAPTLQEAAKVICGAMPNPVFDQLKPILIGEFQMKIPEVGENGEEYMRDINIPWSVQKRIIGAALRALSDTKEGE